MIAEFAQIVGLLAAFSSGRQASESAGISQFLEWLSTHNHSELRDLIEQNQTTTISIKAMLALGFDDIGEKLDIISSQLALLASRTYGIETLVSSLPKEALSDQAFELLSLMEENGTEYFLVSIPLSGPTRLVLAPGPNYLAKESRFLHDDLELMVNLGLLQLDYNSTGNPLYRYTRAASKLFRAKA